jgi:hypothetical protein
MLKLNQRLFIEPRASFWSAGPAQDTGRQSRRPDASVPESASFDPISLSSGWQPPSAARIHAAEAAVLACVVICIAYGVGATIGLF